MPQAVTHFLIPAILVALFRDFYLNKNKKRNFPMHYVLIAGLGGLLIDTDYLFYYIFRGLDFSFPAHRIFFHNIFFVLIFLVLGFIFINTKVKELGKHKLKLSTIFFLIGFASFIHLFLDWILLGEVLFLYPISSLIFGLNILKKVPTFMQDSILPVIDAILLIFWMIYLEVRHRISDYI